VLSNTDTPAGYSLDELTSVFADKPPIGESDSAAIKGFYVALLLACFLLTALFTYWFHQRADKAA